MQKLLALVAAAFIAACAPPAQHGATAPAQTMDLAVVATPEANARVTSPLRVSGVAPANWFFENQFPLRLVDAQGQEIAFAPATPRVNWTEPGDKEFDAEIAFEVAADTPAILVLEEDMPREDAAPRQVRIPIVLTPGS